MPTKYAKKKCAYRPRRRYRKGYKKYPTDLTLVKNPYNGGFPKTLFTTLKYVWNGTFNPGVGGVCAVNVFSCNSPYDPDRTGAGNSCRGFDQWMEIYNHFYVKRSKIIVEFHNGDATYEQSCGISLRDTTSVEASPLEYQEQNTKTRMLGRVGSSHNHAVIKKYWNWKKDNRSDYTDDRNKGNVAGNPTEEQFFHCWTGSPWGNDPSNAYGTVTIYYQVLFTELKDLLLS